MMIEGNLYQEALLSRSRMLFGESVMQKIVDTRVIILGIGGVGGWCAESLIRSGIGNLTIVDPDEINATNCNRQLVATGKTVGMAKVNVMRERLLEINPKANITALQKVFSDETSMDFHLEQYDIIIDAIDSLKDKVSLIMCATSLSKKIEDGLLIGNEVASKLTFFSSMGAALRIDPLKIKVAEFWKVKNDTLGRALRKKMKNKGLKPAVKFKCVFSEELPMENKIEAGVDDVCSYKAQINGSLSHITAIFGFTLAGLVMQELVERYSS